jgi:hypothetical protein
MVTVRICLLPLVAGLVLHGATIGQVDSFSGGTTEGWFVPGASTVPPVWESTGGPEGAGDGYMLLRSVGGDGPGSRFSVLNETQWAGNYAASGIGAIQMDVNNFGPNDLHLRLLFEDFDGPGPPVNLALSANSVHIPAGSGWITISFPITQADLTPGGIGTVAGALGSTDIIRLFHNPDPAFPGPFVGPPAIAANLGVDNITAVPIPEPGTWVLLLAGFAALSVVRRKP